MTKIYCTYKDSLGKGVLIILALAALVSGIRYTQGTAKTGTLKVRGNTQAVMFIAEYSDFSCPYCARIQPLLNKLLEIYPKDLKLVFKHFPLDSIHPAAFPAAEASECAGDQGKFWEYHDLLFRKAEEWNRSQELSAQLILYAENLGLDKNRFAACLASGVKKAIVEQDRQEGLKSFVSGTPTLILNGSKIMQSYKLSEIKQEIEKARARTKRK